MLLRFFTNEVEGCNLVEIVSFGGFRTKSPEYSTKLGFFLSSLSSILSGRYWRRCSIKVFESPKTPSNYAYNV